MQININQIKRYFSYTDCKRFIEFLLIYFDGAGSGIMWPLKWEETGENPTCTDGRPQYPITYFEDRTRVVVVANEYAFCAPIIINCGFY